MRPVLLMLASILPAGYAVASETPVNLVGDLGFEKQPDAGRGTWIGTQNAGRPVVGYAGSLRYDQTTARLLKEIGA